MVATAKSSKNKELQLIQEIDRDDINPKPAAEQKQVRRIVPTIISPEPMEVDDVNN